MAELKKTILDDDAGMALVSINPSIYSLEVAQLAAYTMGDTAHFIFGGDPSDEIVVEIRTKGEESIRTVADRYHEELLSCAVHDTINARNHGIVELILQRVLATNQVRDSEAPSTARRKKTGW